MYSTGLFNAYTDWKLMLQPHKFLAKLIFLLMLGRRRERNPVNIKSVPVCLRGELVVLSEGGQGGEDVTAHRISTRVIKKPVRLDL